MTVEITRDESDFPNLIKIRSSRGQEVQVFYDRDRGLRVLKGKLTKENLELLKLVFPYAEKTTIDTYDSGEFIQADVLHSNSVVVLYTVPPRKKLFILKWSFCTDDWGTAGDCQGYFYVWNAKEADGYDLMGHHFNTTAATEGFALANNGGPIDKGFPAGLSIESSANVDATCIASFFGVLKDA